MMVKEHFAIISGFPKMPEVPKQQQPLSPHACFDWYKEGLLKFRSFCSKPVFACYRRREEKKKKKQNQKDLIPRDYQGIHSQAV